MRAGTFVLVTAVSLTLCPRIASAQEAYVEAGYDEVVGTSPPQWPIGCAVSAGGVPQDIFVSGYFEWSVGGEILGEWGFSAEGYGWAGGYFRHYVDATIEDMTVTCHIEVMFSGFNQIIRRDTSSLVTGLRPFAEIGSDTGNYDWMGFKRRDIWYQIRHADLRNWDLGGTVTESFSVGSNPCNLDISTGVGSVDSAGRFLDTMYSRLNNPPRPECAVVAYQTLRLSTAYDQAFLTQGWWWDTQGVWRR